MEFKSAQPLRVDAFPLQKRCVNVCRSRCCVQQQMISKAFASRPYVLQHELRKHRGCGSASVVSDPGASHPHASHFTRARILISVAAAVVNENKTGGTHPVVQWSSDGPDAVHRLVRLHFVFVLDLTGADHSVSPRQLKLTIWPADSNDVESDNGQMRRRRQREISSDAEKKLSDRE